MSEQQGYSEGFSQDTIEDPQVDYFGFARSLRHYLPDNITWVEFEVMNEGKKSKFQKATQRSLTIKKGSGDASTSLDQAAERHALILESLTDWNLKRRGSSIPFNKGQALRDFLELADPQVIEGIELAIRKANPWLLGEMSSEDIQQQIDELGDLLVIAQERERGEASSASK